MEIRGVGWSGVVIGLDERLFQQPALQFFRGLARAFGPPGDRSCVA